MRITPFAIVIVLVTHLACLPARGQSLDIGPLALTLTDAKQVSVLFQQGERYKAELQHEKSRLFKSIKAFHGDKDTALYKLAGVKLDDLLAFESLVFGMLNAYAQTVYQTHRGYAYDFRTPALKLTSDFQLAIKESHQHLQTNAVDVTALASTRTAHDSSTHATTDEDTPESMAELLQSMLQEVREKADQLEQGMHKHNLVFADSGSRGQIETVLRVDDRTGSTQDTVETLIDQDNNEYIMTRPFDTTVIHEDMQLLHDLILIIIVSFVCGWIFSVVGLPAFFGYIFSGIVTGPPGYNLIKELVQTETLAQLGVVFIVFVLGLEFSIEKLKSTWRMALGGAVMILVITVLAFVSLGLVLGASLKEAIFVGACISLSSTAVVVKVIRVDNLEHLYGLLVMQDVLLGLMLAMIPALAESGLQVFFALLKSTSAFAVFGLVCYALVRLLPLVLRHIVRHFPRKASAYNHELMLLGTVAVCMLMLIVSEQLGLGMELGCFAAGVIVRSRKQLYEASLAVIEPVRDLFACLFFASIGLHIYPSFLASEAVLLLTLAAAVIGFKYAVTSITLLFLRLDRRKATTMAIALGQVSEFAFVLASRAKQLGIISREVYYILLAVTSLTLMATPLLWKLLGRSNHDATPADHVDLGHAAAAAFEDADKFA